MTPEVVCSLCRGDVRPEDVGTSNVLTQVTGYVPHRQSGGANAVRLAEPTGAVAHRWCVDREARGVSARQGAML